MSSSTESEILQRITSERSNQETQVNAKFSLIISPSTTVGIEVGALAYAFQNLIFKRIKNIVFQSPITGFVFFPSIHDPTVFIRENSVSYKRKEKCFFVIEVITYEDWVTADLSRRIELLSDCLISSLERVPIKYFLDDDRVALSQAINQAKAYLLNGKVNK